MKKQINVPLPLSFQSSLFFQDQRNIEVEVDEQSNDVSGFPFLYDLLFHNNQPNYMPWLDRENSIPRLFEQWKRNKELLASLFQKRNRREAKPIAIISVAYFLMSVFWVNKEPVASLCNIEDSLSSLKIKPVNCEERVRYIIDSPDHYHSFIQLTQLFDELNKQYHKALLIQKK